MTSFKQFEANRLNALKSTGPRTEKGKLRSRQNALRHGLTAETVIGALENATDYQAFEASIGADYHPHTATERELVSRLVSVLWRLRRSTRIETGLFQIYGEMTRNGTSSRRKSVPLPEWYDDLDAAPAVHGSSITPADAEPSSDDSEFSETLACCFLRASRLEYGAFDLLSRYETALWRQAAQLFFMLQSAGRR